MTLMPAILETPLSSGLETDEQVKAFQINPLRSDNASKKVNLIS